jgi:hypothetical protein
LVYTLEVVSARRGPSRVPGVIDAAARSSPRLSCTPGKLAAERNRLNRTTRIPRRSMLFTAPCS